MINHGLLEYSIIPIVGGKKISCPLGYKQKIMTGGLRYSEVT